MKETHSLVLTKPSSDPPATVQDTASNCRMRAACLSKR
jgi:hypothetical protein